MALSVKVGYIDPSAAGGSEAFTGIGFQPKCLVMFSSALSTAGGFATEAANMYTIVGLGASSSERAVAGGSAENGVAATNSDAYRWVFTDRLIHQTQPNSTGTVLWNVDLTSLDADGFTLSKTTAIANRTMYFALGGTSLTNVKVGGGTVTSGTGTLAFTGVGFVPDLLIFLVKPTSGDGDHENAQMSMGWANATDQVGWSNFYDDGSTTTDADGVLIPGTAIITTAASGISNTAQLQSMDADGFTLNRLVSSGTSYAMAYMALKFSGISTAIGVETQGVATGTKATAGIGNAPQALMLGGACRVASVSSTSHMRGFLGATDGTDFYCNAYSAESGLSTSRTTRAHKEKIAASVLNTAGTPSTTAEADLTSLDDDGFTLDWTTADATAREFSYLAFGTAVEHVEVTSAGPGDVEYFGFPAQLVIPTEFIVTSGGVGEVTYEGLQGTEQTGTDFEVTSAGVGEVEYTGFAGRLSSIGSTEDTLVFSEQQIVENAYIAEVMRARVRRSVGDD